jgi:hypothetical protein
MADAGLPWGRGREADPTCRPPCRPAPIPSTRTRWPPRPSGLSGRRTVALLRELSRGRPAPVAQWTEQAASIRKVGGSTPSGRADGGHPPWTCTDPPFACTLPHRSPHAGGPMVAVAQLVRAPRCGRGGRGFDSRRSPSPARLAGFAPAPADVRRSSAASTLPGAAATSASVAQLAEQPALNRCVEGSSPSGGTTGRHPLRRRWVRRRWQLAQTTSHFAISARSTDPEMLTYHEAMVPSFVPRT